MLLFAFGYVTKRHDIVLKIKPKKNLKRTFALRFFSCPIKTVGKRPYKSPARLNLGNRHLVYRGLKDKQRVGDGHKSVKICVGK